MNPNDAATDKREAAHARLEVENTHMTGPISSTRQGGVGFAMRFCRALFGSGSRRGPVEHAADVGASASQSSQRRLVRAVRRSGRRQSEFVEPLFATRRDRLRAWNRSGSLRRRRPATAIKWLRRVLFQHLFRGFHRRLFLHPELVDRSRERDSNVVLGHDQRELAQRGAFWNGSRQGVAGRDADNWRLSFHSVSRVSALPRRGNRADVLFGGPRRL